MSVRSLVVFCVILMAGCESESTRLEFALPDAPLDRDIASNIVELFHADSQIRLALTEDPLSEDAAIRALLEGTVDVALISNNMPYHSGIATILPLYPTILHIAYKVRRNSGGIRELLAGASIYAGLEGSASRTMFKQATRRLKLDETDYSFVSSAEESPDVAVVFAPVSPERLAEFPEYKLASLGRPEDVGKGSIVDAVSLMNPYLRPFIIPVGTYGDATPEPVLTLAVDKILVTRNELASSTVYELINELLRLRPALAARLPGLFHELSADFDANRTTFVLHSGTLAYLQRDTPTIYERYSGVAEVAVTILVALASATLAGWRIFSMRRKNRIDGFYTETIRIRNEAAESSGDTARREAIARIRALQNEAFDMLVNEKLAADESFRIFVTLSNDALTQLSNKP